MHASAIANTSLESFWIETRLYPQTPNELKSYEYLNKNNMNKLLLGAGILVGENVIMCMWC